jgi:cyclopropane-fatty-acyl-phospholipid synthase
MFKVLEDKIIDALERGKVPELVVRIAIRLNVRLRIWEERKENSELEGEALQQFIDQCSRESIAVVPEKANEQHYEVPANFFALALGKHRKYSSCYYERAGQSLDDAEAIMLAKTCERAQLSNDLDILELGCGWGSLSLFMAARYPGSKITAVSNSNSQREYIMATAQERGLSNLQVITADINAFEAPARYHRVVSVEMFEHMRNHRELLRRVRSWLNDDGKLFVHIFCHRQYAYLYGTEGISNWLGKNFFSGGMMPSDDLLLRYQDHLVIERQWRVSGSHYAQTAEHWLENIKNNRAEVLSVLAKTYGEAEAERWWQRWAIFFIACAELFGFRSGREWYVGHYLFRAR